jgi:hypothetical protein
VCFHGKDQTRKTHGQGPSAVLIRGIPQGRGGESSGPGPPLRRPEGDDARNQKALAGPLGPFSTSRANSVQLESKFTLFLFA